ncbi:CBL-interacting serine/threonine-protein kinase 1-like protein [Tanacetum coccineum]
MSLAVCATQTVQQGESLRQSLLLDNVLVDSKGHIKISDFGFSALPQQYREDGLLHTMCGSPNYNYVSPEILSNRGYDGATLDTWSCGVIFYIILTGYLPFDDRNLGVLYQKHSRGESQARRILDLRFWSIIDVKERITKKRTKNEAKSTKPDSEWKSRKKTKSESKPKCRKVNLSQTQVNPEAKSQEK